MELVIKISKEDFEIMKHNIAVDNPLCPLSQEDIVTIIANGTPLPKGHGRLIDYSWIVDNVIKKLGIKDKRYLLEAEKAIMSIVEIAPTIIEADKAGSEDK